MAATVLEPSALITRIERSAVAAWPGLETVREGSWLWLFANGFTNRANSIRAMAFSDDAEAEARIVFLASRSRERGIRPVFRVGALAGPGIRHALDRLGWDQFHESLIMARALEHDGPALSVPEGFGLAITALTDRGFVEAQGRLQGYSGAELETLRAMVSRMPAGKGLVLRGGDDEPVASMMVVVAGGVAHINNVITALDQRRKGHARVLLNFGLREARELGADLAALAVLAKGHAARTLYARAGFCDAGSYHYRGEG